MRISATVPTVFVTRQHERKIYNSSLTLETSHRFNMNHWISFLIPLFRDHGLRMSIVASVLDDAIGLPSLGGSGAPLAEKNVHFLQQQALGFREEEVDEDDADDERGAEEQKGAVGDVGHHVRGRVDDDELGEPLGTRSED